MNLAAAFSHTAVAALIALQQQRLKRDEDTPPFIAEHGAAATEARLLTATHTNTNQPPQTLPNS